MSGEFGGLWVYGNIEPPGTSYGMCASMRVTVCFAKADNAVRIPSSQLMQVVWVLLVCLLL